MQWKNLKKKKHRRIEMHEQDMEISCEYVLFYFLSPDVVTFTKQEEIVAPHNMFVAPSKLGQRYNIDIFQARF